VPDDEVAFYQDDLAALRHAGALLRDDQLDVTEVLHLTRTIGLSAARIADGVVGFWVDRFGAGGSEGVAGIAELADPERIEDLERVVGYILRRHLLDSVSRRQATAQAAAGGGASIAVGFADLVGFSLLSEQLTDRETAQLVERFEQTATDQIVIAGGRVIKMIGDEVMFSADPADVGEIALSLAESFDSPELPSVRVGAASGRVVAQSGDLYGPAVNLAARATVAARPGTVLISPSLADRYRQDDRYRVVSLRPMRLKGIGVEPLAVLRRAGPTRRAG
jgi:adenylate cyclase